MPKARIAMSKIREIIRLTETAGLSIRKTSRALNVPRPAVDHYLRQARMAGLTWSQVETMSDEELLALLRQTEERQNEPRYVELVRRLPGLAQELGNKHVTRQLLWEEYRKTCPDGYEYSQFCYQLQMYTADTELAMHLEPLSESEEEVDIDARKRAWARFLAKMYEVDPFVCSNCGAEMKAIAIIEDPDEIKRILRHLFKIGRSPRGFDPARLN